MGHQQEMAYGKSIGHVIDDVTWPWKVKFLTSISLGPIISKTGWRYRLGYNRAPIGNGTRGIKMVTWLVTPRDRKCQGRTRYIWMEIS